MSLGMQKSQAGSSRAPSRPNLLFIMTDDLGVGHFAFDEDQLVCPEGVFQHPEFSIPYDKAIAAARKAMPNTAALAGDSIRMRHAFAAAPICSPSRLAVMTGRYPQRFGVYDNFDMKETALPSDAFLAQDLQRAGYRTAVVGKWHLGRYIHNGSTGRAGYGHSDSFGCHADDLPMKRGFDEYFGFNPSGTAYWDSPSLYRNHERVKAKGYLTDEFSDEAVRMVSNESDDPFFLFLSYNAPHTPYDPAPEKYTGRFSTGNTNADNFFGMLAAVDDGIGRIVDALKKRGTFDDTLIIFASDNGAVSNSPLPRNGRNKGYKGMFYAGGTHVPMFARIPGIGRSGWYEKPVSLMDGMPTFLCAAGLPVPPDVDGVNLQPFLSGSGSGLPHEALYWAGPFSPQWAEGDASFDYLRNQSSRGPAGAGICKWPNLTVFSRVSSPEQFDLSNGSEPSPDRRTVENSRSTFRQWLAGMPAPVKWEREEWEHLVSGE